MNIDKEKYLSRIGYAGKTEPTLAVLRQLQKSHLLNVPFENLDIHYGVPIVLDIDKIFKKIVLNGRGAFCYELNGLFFELLTAIGFRSKRVSAKVYDARNEYSREYDHLALVVSLDGDEYLVDVGFGEFTIGPLKLESNRLQHDEAGDFLIDMFDQEYLRVNKVQKGSPVPQYIFRNMHRQLHQFEKMCHYHQTNPDSHFTQNKLITLPTQTGRVTLTGEKLKIRQGDSIEETVVRNEAEFREELWHYFRIRI